MGIGRTAGATRPASAPSQHRVGTGPDSIYLHAVAPRAVAGGPVALCGYPLREATLRSAVGAQGAESFEALARVEADCCPQCLAVLSLDTADATTQRSTQTTSRAWMKWVAIGMAMATSLGGLVRVAISIAQR